jgi:hypothetical protein
MERPLNFCHAPSVLQPVNGHCHSVYFVIDIRITAADVANVPLYAITVINIFRLVLITIFVT